MLTQNKPSAVLPVLFVGLVAAGLDVALFQWLSPAQPLASAQLLSGGAAMLLAFALFARITPATRPWLRRDALLILCIAALLTGLRGGVLGALAGPCGVATAQALSALFLAATGCAAQLWLLAPRRVDVLAEARSGERLVIAAILFSLALRLLYLGQVELIFEEAYYWNYAQHPDIGYLDHPLMVGWLIRLGIGIFGNNEFGVRSPALLFWGLTALFSYRLAAELFGPAVGRRALLLLASLPIFFSFGWFISPDAPLTAFWAMALYYAQRIAVHDERRAWLGFGLAIGLAAISKYTIFLLLAAFGLHVLRHARTRAHLRGWQPWAGLLIALALFSPVIVWNLQNALSSFAFQSQARLSSGFNFSLPRFVGNVLVALTPIGLCAVIALWRQRRALVVAAAQEQPENARVSAAAIPLLFWLALFPLAVFASLSIGRVSKLNWTGPLWLALLPLLAYALRPGAHLVAAPLLRATQRAWPPMLALCLLFFTAALQHLSSGLPGVGYPHNLHLIGWREFAPQVEALVSTLERARGEPILVVGMDRNRIASGLAFYRRPLPAGLQAPGGPVDSTASEHLFDDVGLMYERWFPVAGQSGRSMLLIGAKRGILDTERVRSRATTLGEIGEWAVQKNGRPAGRYYYRLLTGYKVLSAAPDGAAPGNDD